MDQFLSNNTNRQEHQIINKQSLLACLTTRAVHLELSIDMTTDSFLMALRRFIAGRGELDIIWCNRSNFAGVKKELKQVLQNVKNDLIAKELALENIEWKFLPPISPWMGGALEIMVKLTKRALKTVTNDRPMQEEVLKTFLIEVESTLNGRALNINKR